MLSEQPRDEVHTGASAPVHGDAGDRCWRPIPSGGASPGISPPRNRAAQFFFRGGLGVTHPHIAAWEAGPTAAERIVPHELHFGLVDSRPKISPAGEVDGGAGGRPRQKWRKGRRPTTWAGTSPAGSSRCGRLARAPPPSPALARGRGNDRSCTAQGRRGSRGRGARRPRRGARRPS